MTTAPAPAATLGSEVTIDRLSVNYGDFTALRDVSLTVPAGTTTALVGESGSGKSTLALAAGRILPPGASISGGSVTVGDTELTALRGKALREARGHTAAYLAQDASAALNPVIRVGKQIAEVHQVRCGASRAEAAELARQGLADVGIPDPDRVARLYPGALSGGMRQRVIIAIALAFRPQLLIADEPTTALDVTVQADILALVSRLQQQCGLTVIWITHDMSVVAELADHVAVLYGGRLVEHTDVLTLFEGARHPYTQALLTCFQSGRFAGPKQPFTTISGSPPVAGPPGGCPFHPRCPQADARCGTELPAPRRVGHDHTAACHRLEETP
ncbi:ABC transporter ATP-binding protein [Streptomyces cucumeris]|uniref:ABC transporter ATP-binding protein n=1 Tax=Streptomyces TaxID=1883 RepID=UPI0020C88E1F|nr:ABC transporter ATP-binding protein [Streptomyces sp. NEAU-Y11]MCP9211956.1 ABC transporter ATP-binding protein [Streptomyces sp. NEAU-Y11]